MRGMNKVEVAAHYGAAVRVEQWEEVFFEEGGLPSGVGRHVCTDEIKVVTRPLDLQFEGPAGDSGGSAAHSEGTAGQQGAVDGDADSSVRTSAIRPEGGPALVLEVGFEFGKSGGGVGGGGVGTCLLYQDDLIAKHAPEVCSLASMLYQAARVVAAYF